MINRITVILILVFTGCTGSTFEQNHRDLPVHHTQNGFTNPYINPPKKNFFTFLKMRLFGDDVWADHQLTANEVPIVPLDMNLLQGSQPIPRVTWLGHSSFLIQYRDTTILTDPIFSDRASPIPFLGPKRYVAHSADYERLPPIDYVIISHNHYDHLDEHTIQLLGNHPHYLVPLALKAWLINTGIDAKRITELDWWQNFKDSAVSATATPSQHWSARGLFDRFDTLWASWFIELSGWGFWFAGDTGYNPIQFREIGEKISSIPVALIPIGAYKPRWFMRYYHVNPQEAIQIHKDIGAKLSIGMHWGTFPLTAEPPIEPQIALEQAKKEAGIADSAFITMAIGETRLIELPKL